VVFFEPLNRYEDHMVNRIDQACELCDAVGLDSVKVMGDLFHMNIEEDDPPASLRAGRRHLAHIHLADSNRAQPGTGHVDFRAAFAALDEIGFEGWLALECGLRGDPHTVLPEIVRYLRGCST
jgi:sugar phosphate isomerase/epimerase